MEPDELPRPKKSWIEPQSLDPYSVEDLHHYIDSLEAEIARVRAAIAAKQSHRSLAENFFKK